jgi:riboflavin kinase/FMN adenylyltransferase
MLTELARYEMRRVAPGRPTAVTIGVFDGVHLGHQRLFAGLREMAAARGLASVILTVHPAPVAVLRPDIRIRYITTLEERLRLLRREAVDKVGRLTFTSELAQVSAMDFMRGLREELDLRLIVGGEDLTVGRAREGTVAWLRAHGPELGYEVGVVPFLTLGDRKMGSSGIREALARGDVETAARVLGRPYSLHGPVIHGAHFGRALGFPTANIAVAPDLAIPADGIYVTRAWLGETGYPAVTYIGTRPAVDGGARSIETHLLDFDADIYDQELRVDFLARVREDRTFAGLDELAAQIGRDIAAARAYFQR